MSETRPSLQFFIFRIQLVWLSAIAFTTYRQATELRFTKITVRTDKSEMKIILLHFP